MRITYRARITYLCVSCVSYAYRAYRARIAAYQARITYQVRITYQARITYHVFLAYLLAYRPYRDTRAYHVSARITYLLHANVSRITYQTITSKLHTFVTFLYVVRTCLSCYFLHDSLRSHQAIDALINLSVTGSL